MPIWNEDGYFFVDTGFTELKDYIGAIDSALKSRGLIDAGAEVKEVSGPEEAERFHPYLWPTLCGHMKVKGSRVRKYLGWEPREGGILDVVPEVVDALVEALREGSIELKSVFLG